MDSSLKVGSYWTTWWLGVCSPYAKCMQSHWYIFIVKQQEVVTYMSPVVVSATGIRIFNWNNWPRLVDCSLLKVLIYGGSKGEDMEFQIEQDCVRTVQRAQMHDAMAQNAKELWVECYMQNDEKHHAETLLKHHAPLCSKCWNALWYV